jgi:serine protease Do
MLDESNNINNSEIEEVSVQNEVETIEIKDNNKSIKKKNKIVQVILIGALSLSCGFLGGYIQDVVSPKNTTIVEQLPTESSISVNSGQGMSLQEVIANEKTTVVEILSEIQYSDGLFNQNVTSQSSGSGVIISADGYIVTNYHVIELSENIQITLSDGTIINAEIIASDSKTDLAILKIEGSNYDFAIFGDSDSLTVGDTAIAIGNPLGTLGGSVTTGIISALDREITVGNETMTLLQTNAEINPGNSGGGLFNDQGLLVGIVNAKSAATNVEGIGFAIPSNEVKEVVTQLINDGYVSDRATLGIYVTEVTQDTELYPAGLYITDFIENSNAKKAGLEIYDQITKVDNIDISSYNDLSYALQSYNAGDIIMVEVLRNKEILNIEMTLSEAKNPNPKK